MNEQELRELLDDPKRILNIARVFHHLLHEYDKMEEEKNKGKGVQKSQLKDELEITCTDKDGKIKAHIKQT